MTTPVVGTYNILMIAPTMFFADYGGHIRILEEAKTLRSFGHHVTILTYPNGRNIADLDIRRGFGVPFNYRVEVGSSRHKFYLDFMLGARALSHALNHKPDLIHAHMHEGALIGWMLSRLTGAPLIFDFQGSLTGEMLDHNFIKKSSKLFKPMAWLEHRIDHLPKAILTSSLHGAGLLREQFDVPAGRIHPTPDCVDAITFDPGRFNRADQTALKEAWGIPLNKKLIVYAGILTEYQGTGHLLQALKLLRDQRDDFHLLLMGFPSVEHYRMIATQLGVADLVTFTGKMPYESLPIHLSLGDVATAPKLSATEGCGKILNYMSMALPTVVYDTAVSREFLGQLGIYAQERTAAGLALALGQALDLSHQERTAIGATLRQWVTANYSWERTARQIEWVYAAVLAGHPQPAFVAKRALI